jgi:phenylalanyl-tRNA synthetase alpha chain
MAELSAEVLSSLCKRDEIDTLTLSSLLNVEHEKIVGAVKSLQSKGDVSVRESCHSSPAQ